MREEPRNVRRECARYGQRSRGRQARRSGQRDRSRSADSAGSAATAAAFSRDRRSGHARPHRTRRAQRRHCRSRERRGVVAQSSSSPGHRLDQHNADRNSQSRRPPGGCRHRHYQPFSAFLRALLRGFRPAVRDRHARTLVSRRGTGRSARCVAQEDKIPVDRTDPACRILQCAARAIGGSRIDGKDRSRRTDRETIRTS